MKCDKKKKNFSLRFFLRGGEMLFFVKDFVADMILIYYCTHSIDTNILPRSSIVTIWYKDDELISHAYLRP